MQINTNITGVVCSISRVVPPAKCKVREKDNSKAIRKKESTRKLTSQYNQLCVTLEDGVKRYYRFY